MSSRMQRYEQNSSLGTKSRTSRNQELYQNLGSFQKYTTFTDIPKIEAIPLDEVQRKREKREGYRVIKNYDFLEEKPKVKKELEEFNFLYHSDKNKSYDLNTILKEARQLREKDDLERKRKLHNEKYNILESSEEEIQKFKEEQERKRKPIENEEELEELIHSITSKELREKIDQEQERSLLSDLMATSDLDDVLEPVKEEIKEPSPSVKKEKEKPLVHEIDKSFYTKSMDLSVKDFDGEEEEATPKGIVVLRVIFSLLLIVAVGLAVYYVVMNF